MRIGYPCQNLSVGCTSAHTFRLASYTRTRLLDTIAENLACLWTILQFNAEHGILFFRLSSDIVPFASHPVCRVKWQRSFQEEFAKLGTYIRQQGMRISMHPDQFTLINSCKRTIFERSVRELRYHAHVLDLMGLGLDAKIQIHVGGVYGDKEGSLERFVQRFRKLPAVVRRRLAVENDDVSYTLGDCLSLHRRCRVPVIFDVLHHQINPSGESMEAALDKAASTWRGHDGLPMVDYSEQAPSARKGTHAQSLDPVKFKRFLRESRAYDFDIMLEIKDKETSAVRALRAARRDPRLR